MRAPLDLFPSEYTHYAFRMPNTDGTLVNFDFTGREYLLPIYDTPAKNILLKFGRQCEKTVQEDTPVVNEYGELVPIKRVSVGDKLATMLTDGSHMGVRPVIWKSGRYRKRCVRVTTQLGHVVDLGYTHPVRQWERWTIADALRPGDRVASVRELKPKNATVTEETFPAEAADTLLILLDNVPEMQVNEAEFVEALSSKTRSFVSRTDFLGVLGYLKDHGIDVSALEPHTTTDLFWDTVVSVEDLGEQWCYDLEILETNNFVTVGLVTHNSTTLGNKLIAYSVLRPFIRSLYVTPSEQQTTVFSSERVATPIEMSPVLQNYMRNMGKRRVVDNVLLKVFNTGSRITFRYAHYDADSSRGISADKLVVDEIQDIILDVLPVLEECISHGTIKTKEYAGTPKTFDNPVEHYWSQFSTQYEWVIPCDRCGGGDYRHWNVIVYESVQPKGLSCTRCGKLINPRHPDAGWASMRDENWLRNPPNGIIPFEGYRIAQPMVSWLSWEEVYDKKVKYPMSKFHNEILGLSYDAGEKLINRQALIDSSDSGVDENTIKNAVGRIPLFMGIDWGGGSETSSFTAISIIGYTGDKLTVFYMKRLTGIEAEPGNVVDTVCRLIDTYKIHLIGCDYGGGLDRNDRLIRRYGLEKILRYQYVNTKKIYFDSSLMRWMANRTEVLMALVNAINRTNVFRFPRWELWEYTAAPDIMSLLLERNDRTGTSTVIRVPGQPDDIAHSLLYAFLASMVVFPRPDILTPDKEATR